MPLPFLKKASKPEEMPPIERVKDLTSKGFSELEVIDVLRKEGYSTNEIDKALSQSLKGGVVGTTEHQTTAMQTTEEPTLPVLEELERAIQAPEVQETSLPSQYYGEQNYQAEQYIDYMIKERMGDAISQIGNVSIKANELEQRIDNLREQLKVLIQSKTLDQNQLLNKIDSFKENIDDMNIRLGGVEKAFKETLPALIESVRALSDLVQRFKKEA